MPSQRASDMPASADHCQDPLVMLARAEGIVDVEFLYSDETWTTRDGRTVALAGMDADHARSIIAMLTASAQRLHRSAYWRNYMLIAEPTADMAQMCFEREREDFLALDPQQWLMSTPLGRALTRAAGELAPAGA